MTIPSLALYPSEHRVERRCHNREMGRARCGLYLIVQQSRLGYWRKLLMERFHIYPSSHDLRPVRHSEQSVIRRARHHPTAGVPRIGYTDAGGCGQTISICKIPGRGVMCRLLFHPSTLQPPLYVTTSQFERSQHDQRPSAMF